MESKEFPKPTELRLGNFVWNDVQKIPVPVDLKILSEQCNRWKRGEGLWSPIPLTEEWLERFGFENEWEDIFNHKDEYFPIVKHNGYYFFSADMHHHTCNGIRFVHELQNTFKAITGEELKYSLNYTPNKEES